MRNRLPSIQALNGAGLLLLALVSLSPGCGDDTAPTAAAPPPATPPGQAPGAAEPYSPTQLPLGAYDFSCDGKPGSQAQQQVQFQQQQQSGGSCTPQFQFYSSKISEFKVDLDCKNGHVVFHRKGLQGFVDDDEQISLPIQDNGEVHGSLRFQNQVQNDGKGHISCWVQNYVRVDGKVVCARPGSGNRDMIDLSTSVDFEPSNPSDIPASSSDGLVAYASLAEATSILQVPDLPQLPQTSPSPGPGEPGVARVCPSSLKPPKVITDSEITIHIPSGAMDKKCDPFGQGPISVRAGTEVTWVNDDTVNHTVTSDSVDLGDFASSDDFDSGVIEPGESYTHRFDDEGAFGYHCKIHPSMKGIVMVKPKLPLPGPSLSPLPPVSPSPSPKPSLSPIPFPSLSPLPSPEPSLSPSPVPSPKPSPSPSPKPSASPKPTGTGTQVVTCFIEKPCPVVGKTSYSCPAQQQQ